MAVLGAESRHADWASLAHRHVIAVLCCAGQRRRPAAAAQVGGKLTCRQLHLLVLAVGEAAGAPTLPRHGCGLVGQSHHPLRHTSVGLCVLGCDLLLFMAGQVDLEVGELGECPCVVDDRLILLQRGGTFDRWFDVSRLAGERQLFPVFGCDLALEPVAFKYASNEPARSTNEHSAEISAISSTSRARVSSSSSVHTR